METYGKGSVVTLLRVLGSHVEDMHQVLESGHDQLVHRDVLPIKLHAAHTIPHAHLQAKGQRSD